MDEKAITEQGTCIYCRCNPKQTACHDASSPMLAFEEAAVTGTNVCTTAERG